MGNQNTIKSNAKITGKSLTASFSEARWRLGLNITRDAVFELAESREALVDGRIKIDAFRGATVTCDAPKIMIIERLRV
jgi:hypothetical protein